MKRANILTGISMATRVLLDETQQVAAIQKAISALGKGVNVDRCYIFQIEHHHGNRYLSQRFEWVKDEVSIQIDNPRLQMLPEAMFPWLMEKLDIDEILYGLVSQSNDPLFKEAMEEQDIKTYLFTPIQADGELWGFIGYDDCEDERRWLQEEVEALATVAKNIGIRLSWDRTKARLEERNEMFELAVEGANLGKWEWNPLTNQTQLSDSVKMILGYKPNEVDSNFEVWHKHIHPEDVWRVDQALDDYLSHRNSQYEVAYRIVRNDGGLRWLQSNGMAKRDEQGNCLLMTGFLNDITDRVLADEAREQALQRALELSELKSNFVSMASHQFRTPLTVIYSNIELMEMGLVREHPHIAARISKSTRRIKDEVDRMTELMNNILTFGRYEAGLMTIRLEPLAVDELIRKINAQYFSQEGDGRSIQIEVKGQPRSVMADNVLLSHALSNLLSNALKYSKDRPSPQVHIQYGPEGVQIDIRDFGIGIPLKDQANTFSSFFRASNATTIVGTGLGLPIVKEFIERHGGRVGFESEENVGTTFRVFLKYE